MRKPQKEWSVFLFVAMMVTAGFFMVYDFFFPSPKETAASNLPATSYPPERGRSERAGQLPATDSTNFAEASWLLPQAEKDAAPITPMKAYAITDLVIGKDDTSAAIRVYAADLKSALQVYANPKLPSEVIATMDAYENPAPEHLARIQASADGHAATVAKLLQVSTPPSVAPYHLILVNTVARLDYLSHNMLLVESNPLVALTSARIFGKEVEKLGAALEVLNNVFVANGLKFGSQDGIKIYLHVNQ